MLLSPDLGSALVRTPAVKVRSFLWVAPALVLATAAGCGGAMDDLSPADAARTISGQGMQIELPPGWTGRIVVAAEGRLVLHAASFLLPANDSDTGQVAQETIGSRGQLYINVRSLGPARRSSTGPLPVAFTVTDFGPPPPGPGSRCCFIRVASRSVVVSEHGFLVTVVSGSDDPPEETTVAAANRVLATLSLAPYVPEPVAAATGARIARYGLSMRLPDGWEGRISRGTLEAASYALQYGDRPEPGEIYLRLLEHGATDANPSPFVTGRFPLQLGASEFLPAQKDTAESGRSFVASGRRFVLWASSGSLPPSAGALERANAALAALTIEPGDFYPGTVEPASFAPAPGWYSGTSGATRSRPDGDDTWSWTATVPLDDRRESWDRWLGELPPDGIVVQAYLSRNALWPPTEPDPRSSRVARAQPYQIEDAETGSFEGVPPTRALYRLNARVPDQYDVDLWIFFGRAHPTEDQLKRAQAALDRLELPRWPAWELER